MLFNLPRERMFELNLLILNNKFLKFLLHFNFMQTSIFRNSILSKYLCISKRKRKKEMCLFDKFCCAPKII